MCRDMPAKDDLVDYHRSMNQSINQSKAIKLGVEDLIIKPYIQKMRPRLIFTQLLILKIKIVVFIKMKKFSISL